MRSSGVERVPNVHEALVPSSAPEIKTDVKYQEQGSVGSYLYYSGLHSAETSSITGFSPRVVLHTSAYPHQCHPK